MSLPLPLPEPPSDTVLALSAQLDAARTELHEAQRILVLLDVHGPISDAGDAVGVARSVIERDLARRRVDAWTAILDRLRAEADRHGLFG